jgi:hemin uptake protein HemP
MTPPPATITASTDYKFMTELPFPKPGDAAETAAPARTIMSHDLFEGRREVIIQHGDQQYRLRLTNSNKLILVK